jgi:hypothetical protein
MSTPNYWVGLDLGQTKDPTALAVVERSKVPDAARPGRSANRFGVKYLRRWPLGTSYVQIVADVKALVDRPPLPGCSLVVDKTGVGAGVVDLLRSAGPRASLYAVTITAGTEVFAEGLEYHVPKKDLVAVLQVALQAGRLAIAALPEAAVLAKELANFRVKVTAAANETFGAWRDGQHDDLVLAVALACWLAERFHPSGSGWAEWAKAQARVHDRLRRQGALPPTTREILEGHYGKEFWKQPGWPRRFR